MSAELLGVTAVLFLAIVGGLWTVYTRLDSKLDSLGAKLDGVEEKSTARRHAFRNEIQAKIGGIDEDLKDHGERIAKLERNGH